MQHIDRKMLKRAAPAPGLLRRLQQAGRKLVAPAARGPNDMQRLLQRLPHPLIDPRARMVVLYSPKSACTNVVIWFLHHLGHGQAARDFHVFPHRYRNQVYYRSALYRRACRLDLTTFKVVRVVRDPFSRAVSSFRHVLRTKLFRDDMGKKLGNPQLSTSGLSFADFLGFLEQTDLTRCNPHYGLQRHPVEDLLPVHYLINVSRENLFERLAAVEADLGLPPSNLAQAKWVARQSRRHNEPQQASADAYSRVFTPAQAGKGPWPSYDDFLTEEARARIARLYAPDIKAYLEPAPSSNQN